MYLTQNRKQMIGSLNLNTVQTFHGNKMLVVLKKATPHLFSHRRLQNVVGRKMDNMTIVQHVSYNIPVLVQLGIGKRLTTGGTLIEFSR